MHRALNRQRRSYERPARRAWLLCACAITLTASAAAFAAQIVPVSGDDAGASLLATSISAEPGTMVGARFITHPPSGTPNAVSDALLGDLFCPVSGTRSAGERPPLTATQLVSMI